MTSETNGTDCNKTTRICQKPVVVELNGNHIEATHHIVNDDAGLLHLYIGDRSDGIDVTVPLCSDKPPYARSDRGAQALGLNDGVEVGDVVTVRDEDRSGDPGPYKVQKIEGGEAELWSSMQPMRYEPVEDLTVVEEAEDTTLPHSVPGHDDGEDDDGPVVMTDGGRDVPTCARCGGKREDWEARICRGCASRESLEIIENADVEPGDVVKYVGARDDLQGTVWVFDDYLEYHATALIDDDGNRKLGVDVRDLQAVGDDYDGEVPTPPYASYDVTDHHSNTLPDEEHEHELVTDGGRVTCVTCGTLIENGHMPDGSTVKWCTDCRDDCKRDGCDKQEHPSLPLDGYCSPWCATEDASSDPALDHYDSTGWV